MLKPDRDGRYPVREREYGVLKALASIYNIISNGQNEIKERLKLTKRGWMRFRQIEGILTRLLDEVYHTVPQNKLIAMRRDMENCYADIKIRTAATGWKPKEEIIVEMDDLMAVMKEATEVKCWGCDKRGKEAKKCSLYQHMDRMLVYEYDTVDVACPFSRGDIAGYTKGEA